MGLSIYNQIKEFADYKHIHTKNMANNIDALSSFLISKPFF